MEFISAEEFLKQPKEIQKVFLDWWKPEMYDFFFRNFTNENGFLKGIYEGCIKDNEVLRSATKDKSFLPLLTEGQLRKFIENKTDSLVYINTSNGNYYIGLWQDESMIKSFKNLGTDLLQAYWKVALEIAKEGLHE
jgi:hypothetical protein